MYACALQLWGNSRPVLPYIAADHADVIFSYFQHPYRSIHFHITTKKSVFTKVTQGYLVLLY